MTPDQRAALHRALDMAISLGASVQVNIHSAYAEDDQPLTDAVKAAAASYTTRHFTDDDSPTGREYQVVKAHLSPLADVALFTKHEGNRPGYPSRAQAEAITSRRYDVV